MFSGSQAALAQTAERPAPDPVAGRAAYQQQCARCHGDTGQGDGRDAKRLYPRPRDLTSGVFKFRSTVTGTAPTDDDLFRTLEHGLTAGNMPDWSHLDAETKWHLIAYLKTLTDTFETSPPEMVDLGKDPGPKGANLAAGKQVYEKLGCAACHGVSGRANGISSATLVDNWDQPIRAADLTQGWNFRGGAEPRSIAMRILGGIDGTPMPSYAEAATKEEVWQLAYYIRSLQQEPRWDQIVAAAQVAGSLPTAADDPRWNEAKSADVRLRQAVTSAGEMTGPASVSAVRFTALVNEDSIAFRIVWHDPSHSLEAPLDRLALVLRPKGVAGDVVTLQAWPIQHSPSLDFCVWASDGSARELVANRYEPVTGASSGRSTPLAAAATFADGVWTLVLTRPLSQPETVGPLATFERKWLNQVAFVVWDGGNADQRMISPWIDVQLPKPPHAGDEADGDGAAHEAPEAKSSGAVVAISAVVGLFALVLALRR